MTMFILQSAVLIAIAFAIGAVCGCLARRWLAPSGTVAIAPRPRAIAAPGAAPAREIEVTPAEPATPAPPAAPQAPAATAAEPAAPRGRAPSRKAKSPSAAPPATTGRDDLKKISGIGRQGEARLNAAGVTRYAQIAAWKPADQKRWGEALGFPGRVEREEWVAQAKALAAGGGTSFSKRVEAGDVPTSAASPAAKPAGRPRRKPEGR